MLTGEYVHHYMRRWQRRRAHWYNALLTSRANSETAEQTPQTHCYNV